MKAIPQATTIALTAEERRRLEALANSRKSEARMRDRARIVLLATSGVGSRPSIRFCQHSRQQAWFLGSRSRFSQAACNTLKTVAVRRRKLNLR